MRLLTLLAVAGALAPLAAATLTDPIQDDAGSGGDAGDSPWTATPLRNPKERDTADGTYSGQSVVVDDAEDWYSFEMRAGGPVRLEFRAKSDGCALPAIPQDLAPVSVVLVGPDGTAVRQEAPSPCGFHAALDAVAHEAGQWLVGIEFGIAKTGGVPAPGGFGVPLSSPSTPEMDYELTLGCKPVC